MYEQQTRQQPQLSQMEQQGFHSSQQQAPIAGQPLPQQQLPSQQQPQLATATPEQQQFVDPRLNPARTSTEQAGQSQQAIPAQEAPLQQQPVRETSIPAQQAQLPQQPSYQQTNPAQQSWASTQQLRQPSQGETQQPIQQAPVQQPSFQQQPIQQAPGLSPQLTKFSQSAAQPAVTQQFGQRSSWESPQQEMATRQNVEMADTPVLAEALANRLGMTSQQLGQYIPQLGAILGEHQRTARAYQGSTMSAPQSLQASQQPTLRPVTQQ